MQAVIELIIAVCDLFEAELKQLQLKSKGLFLGFGLVLVIAFAACAGCGLLLAALFLAIYEAGLPLAWSSLLTGCASLIVSGLVFLIFRGGTSR